MSKDLKLDDDGDLVLVNGSPVFVDGLEEVAQSIKSLLMTPKGSFIDTDYGIDMSFIIGGFDENAAIQATKDAINQDKRVIEIEGVDIEPDYESGIAVIKASVATTLGNINLETGVSLNATD